MILMMTIVTVTTTLMVIVVPVKCTNELMMPIAMDIVAGENIRRRRAPR